MKTALSILILFLFSIQTMGASCFSTTGTSLKGVGSKGTPVKVYFDVNFDITVVNALTGKEIDPNKFFSRNNRETFTLEDGREISRSMDDSYTFEWSISNRKNIIREILVSQNGIKGQGSRGTPVTVHIDERGDILVINLKTGKEIIANKFYILGLRESFKLTDGREVVRVSTESDFYEWDWKVK